MKSLPKGGKAESVHFLAKSQLDIASFFGYSPNCCVQRVMGESALLQTMTRDCVLVCSGISSHTHLAFCQGGSEASDEAG